MVPPARSSGSPHHPCWPISPISFAAATPRSAAARYSSSTSSTTTRPGTATASFRPRPASGSRPPTSAPTTPSGTACASSSPSALSISSWSLATTPPTASRASGYHPGPLTYRLDRLERGFVRPLLERLTTRDSSAKPVIADPDRGWTRLRDRLVDDLESRGTVLPQQLKVVLGGLRGLSGLTVPAYEHAGGLPGLEATFVARGLTAAAQASNLPETAALALLLALVDRDRQPPAKAAPRPAADLAAAIAASPPATIRALATFARDEILRTRGEAEAPDSPWQLDHDYLAGPILRVERERDRWRLLLAERATPFREAGVSFRRRWRGLLPVNEQLQLLLARLRGRFRCGEYRPYALASSLRLLPPAAILGTAVLAAWIAFAYDQAERLCGNLIFLS
jgi:hypothetical protein